jgi:predicted anti-sigma-YlaC factor YlaD
MSQYHVAPQDLHDWVRGASGSIASMSVEQHVANCQDCRTDVAALVAKAPAEAVPDLTEVWSRVRDQIELPPASWFERLLTRLGLPDSDAALVSAAPSWRGPWLTALCSALVFVAAAAAASDSGAGTSLFLLVAPLVPVFAVALAYGPEASGAVEQEAAVPYPLARLVFLRTATVLIASVPVVGLIGILLPGRLSWLWLLPAIGFTATVLGLSVWVPPVRAAEGITLAWVAAVAYAERFATAMAVLDGRYLVLYSVLLVAGPITLIVGSRRLGTIGRIS